MKPQTFRPTVEQMAEAKKQYKNHPELIEHMAESTGYKDLHRAYLRGEYLAMSIHLAIVLKLSSIDRERAQATTEWMSRVWRMIREVDEQC